jgi:TorA maturation chaperone TorD
MIMVENRDIEMEMARGQVYGFFSALFLNPPTAEMLSAILGNAASNAFEPVFSKHPACQRLKELSQEYRRGTWDIEDFILDFDALFRVPGDGYVHPFESVYAGENFSPGKRKGLAVLAGPSLELAALYRDHGIAPGEGFSEFPDHLGVELEFMEVLCRKAAEAFGKEDDEGAGRIISEQLFFLSQHLLKWSSSCLSMVRKRAGTPLYICLADLLEAFLEQERARWAKH